jgi:chemotaxis protein CheD
MPLPSKWVIPPPARALVVGVGDMIATNDAGSELVTYSLGSCVGVVVYDATRRIGGLLHVMLPDSTISPEKAATRPHMFMDTGLPRLFHAVFALGANRQQLVVRMAGGAQVLGDQQLFQIGARNVRAAQDMLARNGVGLHAQDVGGCVSRTLRLKLATGTVMVHSPGSSPYAL